MRNRNKEKIRSEDRARAHDHVICDMCGRKVRPDACRLQEDDEAVMLCQYCEAEKHACGCSD